MTRYALVDCNNFFVSCERVFRPDLAKQPVAVLSNNDGCIVARSNEVKAFNIPMGVPLFKVKHVVRANNIKLFSANFELYGDISQRIVELLRQETPLIEVYSIDECFINLSELPIEDAHEWAVRVRTRIWREVGIPVSVGVAPTKSLAKAASFYAKTHGDGTHVVDDEASRRELLGSLPVGEVWGIGRRLGPKLIEKGISNALQLIDTSDQWLATQFTITGMRMVDELRGEARIAFGDKRDQRASIMCSRSFGHRVRDYFQLESAVATFAAQAAARLRAQDSVCRGIVTFISTGVRQPEHRHYASHLITLPEATADSGQLISSALEGLDAIYDHDFAYQKAGVTLVGITDIAAWQLSLSSDEVQREKKVALMEEVDKLNTRFGKGTVWQGTEARSKAAWQSKSERRSPRYTTRLHELPQLHV